MRNAFHGKGFGATCGLLALVFCSSCVMMSVTRTGERYAQNSQDCDLEFRYGDLQKGMELASTGYVQVGSITIANAGDSFDEALTERVRPRACELGGDIVMMAQSAAGSFSSGSSYASLMVFRRLAR